MSMRQPVPAASLPALSQALADPTADRRIELLRCVARGGSISQAARETGISYKAAWQAIDTLTNLSGVALVDSTVGGSGGGGARITPQGLQLLALADELARARDAVLARFTGGPALVGSLGLRTSMRNQLPCEVLGAEPASPDDPTLLIRLRTAGGAVLAASVTRESADLLALQPGAGALALCKATAVTVAAGQPENPAAPNQLCGRIDRIARGQDRDEVVIGLDGGGQWVGFAAHPLSARRGQRAWAAMAASVLVVGLAGG